MAETHPTLETLDLQREMGIMTDVVLICDGKDFPVHKNILSATSKYFQVMFSPVWDESGRGRIELPTVSSEEIEVILPFLYKGKINEVDDPDLLKKLLKTSHMLECHALFEYCSKKLCERLSCSNCLEVYNLSVVYNDEGMIKSALDFMDQHFNDIRKSEEFLQLNASQLLKIIHHLDTKTTTPMDDIIKGLLQWSEVGVDRQDTLVHILSMLDLQVTSSKKKIKDMQDFSLLKKLLKTSHMLEYHTLFQYCSVKLCETLSCSNCVELYNLSDAYNDEEMRKSVMDFMDQHFTAISRSEEFLKLNPTQLQTIIQQHRASTAFMDDIIKGLLRWSEVDIDRQVIFTHILTTLDLQGISTDFLRELLRKREFVHKNPNILILLTAEATARILPNSSKDNTNYLCFGEYDKKKVFRMYNIRLNQWSASKTLPFIFQTGMSMVWFQGYIYVIGGGEFLVFKPSAKVIKYNPTTNTVASVGKLSVPAFSAGVGVLYESIYVTNGLNEIGDTTTTVQQYNPVTGACELIAPTNNAYCQPHVVSFSNYLYILGSYIASNSVERYDPECNEWTIVTAIPWERHLCGAAIIEQQLIVVSDYPNVFQMYDFAADRWVKKNIEATPKKIVEMHSAKLEGKCILLVRDGVCKLHVYDPESEQWLKQSQHNTEPWSQYHHCLTSD